MNYLHGHGHSRQHGECRAQNLVLLNHSVDRTLEILQIDAAGKPDRTPGPERDPVRVLQTPQPLLLWR
jgi:hypothetical protein